GLGLERACVRDRVAVEAAPLPTVALVEANGVGVVVGRDQPEPGPAGLPGMVDDRVEQRAAGADTPVRRDEHHELGISVDLVPQRAADRATVALDDEAVERRGIRVYAPA